MTEKYNDDSDKSYILEVDVQHSEKLHKLQKDLPIFNERMKIKKLKSL